MAYGLKYELTFDDIFAYEGEANKNVYRIRIYKDGYSSTTYQLTGGRSPVIIDTVDTEGKSFTPIISKRATVNVIKDDNLNVQEFFTAEDIDFKLVVQKGTVNSGIYTYTETLFVGTYVPVEQIIYSPVEIGELSLVFNDGLSNLKEKKIYYDNLFVIGFNASESYSFKDILTNAFSQNGLQLSYNVNWYYKNTNLSDRELENMYVEKNSFLDTPGSYITWYDVLHGLCRKFGFICHQENGEYYLTSYASLTRTNSRTYYRYLYDGTYDSLVTQTDVITTIDATDDFKQINTSLLVTLSKGNKSYTQVSTVQNGIQAVLNGDFSSWANSTTADGWGTGMSYQRYNTENQLRAYTAQSTGLGFGSNIESQPIDAKKGDVISIYSDINTSGLYQEAARVVFIPTSNPLATKYWNPAGYFQDTDYILNHNSFTSTTAKYTYVPEDGIIYVRIYQPYYTGGTIPNLYTYVSYFRIQYFGVNSNVQNFNSIVYESAKDGLFNRSNDSYQDLTFFSNEGLINTIQTDIVYTNENNVAASRFMGAWLTSGRSAVTDTWQRDGVGTTDSLFNFVSEDVGVDELYNQLIIEGDFLTQGYEICKKFSYSYALGVTASTYIMSSYKYDLKMKTQSVKLFAINYGLTTNITRNLYLNSK